ncbi:hypothetical protein [Streptomyces guryensis]|uniref:Uncharacterized protein n=1 Tax=Streptomyces guryensis TaxID=2886947 RepID=A0A9Q3Z836_9ACTN|nr:hypothetical protein [Streptomyces guryensis]MCD9876929.1 hypothetical protein [Streptomyces guryensis]
MIPLGVDLELVRACFPPGAKQRRARMREQEQTTVPTVLHNLAAVLIVFQTAVLYFAAGYWKITGKMWQDGVAMYYIGRITGFEMSSAYAHLMNNAFVGTAVRHFTIFIELAPAIAILPPAHGAGRPTPWPWRARTWASRPSWASYASAC